MRSRISKTNKFLPKHRSWKELNRLTFKNGSSNKLEDLSLGMLSKSESLSFWEKI